MMDEYQYSIAKLPPKVDINLHARTAANVDQNAPYPSTGPSQGSPSGGGGGGSGGPTVDLDLCNGSVARVSGYILP